MKVQPRQRLISHTLFLTFLIFCTAAAAIIGTAKGGQESITKPDTTTTQPAPVMGPQPKPPPIPALLTPKDDINKWKVEDTEVLDGLYDDCLIRKTTRCLGLPVNCLQQKDCTTFLQIDPPNRRLGRRFFSFFMFFNRGVSNAGTDTRNWVGVGINKDGNKMRNSAMVMCYFGVDKNGDQVSGSWTGWATGYKVDKAIFRELIEGPPDTIPVKGNLSVHSFEFQEHLARTFLKCSFRWEFDTSVEIQEGSMKDDNGPLTQMDFKEEDFAILLASGLLADHQVFDVNGKPTFKAHGTSHRTVESKERLTAALCQLEDFCFGTGPSACYASNSQICAFVLHISVNRVRGVAFIRMLADKIFKPKYIGFALSRSINSDERGTASQIFFAYTCEATVSGYRPTDNNNNYQVHLLQNCSLETVAGNIQCRIRQDVTDVFKKALPGEVEVELPKPKYSNTNYYVNCISAANFGALWNSPDRLVHNEFFAYMFISNTSFINKNKGTFSFKTEPKGVYSIRTKSRKKLFEYSSPDFSEHPYYTQKTTATKPTCIHCGGVASAPPLTLVGGGQLDLVIFLLLASLMI